MTRRRVLVVLYGCAILVLLFQGSTPYQQKSAHACHSLDDCGHAQLTCTAGQRLAVLRVTQGYHMDLSHYGLCPAAVGNCSAVADDCCRPPDVSRLECSEDYTLDSGVLGEARGNCSATMARSNDRVTCEIKLPPSPQEPTGRCSNVTVSTNITVYQNLSSYSTVDYACTKESDVVQMCTASKRTGTVLYAVWTSEQATFKANEVNTTCQCRLTSASAFRTRVRGIAHGVRIPKADDVSGDCSDVTVTGNGGTWLNTDCVTETFIFYDNKTQSSETMMFSVTPIDVIMSVSRSNPPDIVLLEFSVLGEGDSLILSCHDAGVTQEEMTELQNVSGVVKKSDDSSSFPVGVTIGVTLVVVVILAIAGSLCYHFLSKRRKQSTGLKEPKNWWWEKTREEDRIADLTQLGPASKVIIDSGRHMKYGKHPTYRRRYPTGDDNPPIHFVSGTAVGRDPDDIETDFDFDNTRPQQPSVPVYHHAGNETIRGQPLAPRVIFSPGNGEDQVVILTEPPPPVRRYDIPPLTIREIE